jgi:hippurate hydrolase
MESITSSEGARVITRKVISVVVLPIAIVSICVPDNSFTQERVALKTVNPAARNHPTTGALDDAALVRGIESTYPALNDLYQYLHGHPELSFQETQTASRLAKELRATGLEVTEGVGKTGVVALLKNGNGPTIMVRADMDALPVTEATGLPYASKATAKDDDGSTVGVMHACGHDIHMTCLVGTARLLADLRNMWSGTVMFVCQPAEERSGGAEAMIKEGLFDRFPKPKYAIALHCDASMPTGQVGFTPGYILANVDSIDITVRGRGGHGSTPSAAIDPIVIACKLVLDLQTIISREKSPTEPGVITVGSIHGGTKHNIIPDEVKLQITVRSYSAETRKLLLDSIENKMLAASAASRAPKPSFAIVDQTPSTFNDPVLTEQAASVAKRLFGPDNVLRPEPRMGGEDFSEYSHAGVPICMFWLGSVAPARLEAAAKGSPLPSLHSSRFYPDAEPTIKTGVQTMTAIVLDLLK